jgi:RimJ/RimL family protein N-acetyltransferase
MPVACAGITFERTHDLCVVASVYTLPRVWPWIGDDYAPEPWTFQPNNDPRIVYLFCREKSLVGLFTFLPQNTVCWEVHIILLPRRKTRGHVILRGALDWMFENSTAQRIVGAVPQYNRLAVQVARRAGMKIYGLNPNSFMKNGKLENQVLFGLSKEVEKFPVS